MTAGEAFFFVGGMYDEGNGLPQDNSEAAAWLRLAADKGDIDAEARLGAEGGMHAEGIGVHRIILKRSYGFAKPPSRATRTPNST